MWGRLASLWTKATVKQCSDGLQDYIYLDENCLRFFFHLRQIFFSFEADAYVFSQIV